MREYGASTPPSDADVQDVAVADRARLVHVAVLAVFLSCVVFTGPRLATELATGGLTPWWANAVGAVVTGVTWLWFRRARSARATVTLHVAASVATVALAIPIAYGMASSVWWLSLVAFSAALMGTRRELLVWAVLITLVVTAGVLLEPHIQVPGAAGETPLEAAMAKIVFVFIIVGVAFGVRRVIQDQSVALAASRAAAERSNEAKRRILAHMSHEVRGPLSTTIALTALSLRDEDLPPHLAHDLRTAHNAARLVLRLIEDVLDASRLDVDDAFAVRHEPFRLHRSVGEVLEPLRHRMRDAGLAYAVTAAPGMPERRLGDGDRVCQVALNLVTNALKFTETGSIRVHLEPADDDPELVCLSVADTGPGIPPAERERIFQPYVQLSGNRRREAGAGLGLTITRLLVTRMGGHIEVESTLGLGTTFRAWMRLPVEHAPGQDAGPTDLLAAAARVEAPEPAHPVGPPQGAPLSVLIVDDDPVNRLVLQKLLSNLGHLATQRDSGRSALEAVACEEFDVLLTDIDMPDLDGFELVTWIRALERRERRRALPVVAVTGHASPEWRVRAEGAGMSGYLIKPITVEELAAELGRVVTPGVRAPRRRRRREGHTLTTGDRHLD